MEKTDKKNYKKGNGIIGVIIIVVIIWIIFSLFSNNNFESNSYGSLYSDDYEENKNYYNVENPYNDGSGHFAGYKWAEENDVDSCGGNSNSFIEGCEEYLEQKEYSEQDEY